MELSWRINIEVFLDYFLVIIGYECSCLEICFTLSAMTFGKDVSGLIQEVGGEDVAKGAEKVARIFPL